MHDTHNYLIIFYSRFLVEQKETPALSIINILYVYCKNIKSLHQAVIYDHGNKILGILKYFELLRKQKPTNRWSMKLIFEIFQTLWSLPFWTTGM